LEFGRVDFQHGCLGVWWRYFADIPVAAITVSELAFPGLSRIRKHRRSDAGCVIRVMVSPERIADIVAAQEPSEPVDQRQIEPRG